VLLFIHLNDEVFIGILAGGYLTALQFSCESVLFFTPIRFPASPLRFGNSVFHFCSCKMYVSARYMRLIYPKMIGFTVFTVLLTCHRILQPINKYITLFLRGRSRVVQVISTNHSNVSKPALVISHVCYCSLRNQYIILLVLLFIR